MKWIWQHDNWPNFEYDSSKLIELDNQFHLNAGKVVGVISHISSENLDDLKIDILTQEALSSSSIEGEILQRDSVQSSIRRHLGLKTDFRKIPAAAAGVSEMMVDVHVNFDQPLTHETLFEWHKMLKNGSRDLEIIGNYRAYKEPMQIVSGNFNSPKVFYQAPPSDLVPIEMERFITWYTDYIHDTKKYSFLAFIGITHLYFEVIHPFEDGNGRIGRALVEKAISQKLGTPNLNSFSKIIEQNKKEYYDALGSANFGLKIDKWLQFFAEKIIESQDYTIQLVGFLVAKTKFFSKFNGVLNTRQEKVILRVFDEGLEGFKGGLSAANYQRISGASPATATRDLLQLVNLGVFHKTGELKGTRYSLNL